jgi:hypothetical protein
MEFDMKAYEITKGSAEIARGRVMMAIEGVEAKIAQIVEAMQSEGYYSTQCADVGDKDGEIIEYFVIARADKKDFVQTYKSFK